MDWRNPVSHTYTNRILISDTKRDICARSKSLFNFLFTVVLLHRKGGTETEDFFYKKSKKAVGENNS